MSGHQGITRCADPDAREGADLPKRSRVEQRMNSLDGGERALGVLPIDPLLTAHRDGGLAMPLEARGERGPTRFLVFVHAGPSPGRW